MLYYAFVHSHLSYGVEIYGNSYQTCMSRLIVVNNKILRILQNQSLRTHVCELYVSYNALTIPALHKLKILTLVHKFFHHRQKLPTIFTSYFNTNQTLYNYNTRGKNNLYVDSCNTRIGQKSVRHKGPKLWNELPTSLKLCTSTKTFNRQLKTYLRSITG